MDISRRGKIFFLILLIILNIILRIPSYSHERGTPDEFSMYSLANSLSIYGHANWWTNTLSIFGFYPYSYGSATAFIFSGISQSSDLSMEWIAWILPAILGIFVILSMYLVAGLIINDDVFKLLVAFTFSISQGVLNYTTWQVSARGFFVMLLPFSIFLLLKTRTIAARFGILTFFFSILIMATHKYYIFLIIFIISFIIIIVFYKLERFIKLPETLTRIGLIAGIIGMFLLPFFTGLFIYGSRYNALQYILSNSIRYSGVLIILAVGGSNYLIFKRNKEFGEWFLLLSLIFFVPFFYINLYGQFVSNFFISTLICIGIIVAIKASKENKKYIFCIIIITMLVSVGFSAFYQHWRTQRVYTDQWHMDDTTYTSAVWIKENIHNKNLVGSDDHSSTRILAISKVPTLVMQETDITYGFVNISDIKAKKNSPLSVAFYMDGPYVPMGEFHQTNIDKWELPYYEVDSSSNKKIFSKYNLSYFIENKYRHEGSGIKLLQSLEKKRSLAYSNGVFNIWCLDSNC